MRFPRLAIAEKRNRKYLYSDRNDNCGKKFPDKNHNSYDVTIRKNLSQLRKSMSQLEKDVMNYKSREKCYTCSHHFVK
jgi:hypothetical protein